MLNPYASLLGSRPPLAVIAATAGQLQALAARLGPSGLEQPRAPGKWTARQIFSHLADCEIAFGFRLRQAVAEERHTIQPFDQDLWARGYAHTRAEAALAAFLALRQWNVEFIERLAPAQLAKKVMHPDRGEMTVAVIVETMAGHDLNHLAQLETIAARPPAAK